MSAALALALLAFLVTVPWGGAVVRALLRRGIGKQIRYDGPESHQTKAGTATMGGILFLAPILLGGVAVAIWVDAAIWAAVGIVGLYAVLGAVDDLKGLRDRRGVGWLARFKFIWQWALAGVAGFGLYLAPASHVLRVPLSAVTVDLGWAIIPIAAVLIVSFCNGVNLSDGLDGLATGLSLAAYGAFGVLALSGGQRGVGLFCALAVGALLAFLWHNAHPASMFMGDVGAEALGAGLAAVAVLSGQWLLLPVVGLVFVAELVSDVLQVGYYKWTRHRYGEGRRIFKMAPLHHHFEMLGWHETKIVTRFWIVAVGAGLLALWLRSRGAP